MEEKEIEIIKGDNSFYKKQVLDCIKITLIGLLLFMIYICIEYRMDGDFICTLPFVIVFIILLIFWFYISKMEIVITNKRVYGKVAFGKRVDLPFDSISAVGTSFLKGIDIGTSSGRIHFKGIKNNNEIHAEISKLLNNRQNEKQLKETTTSTTDEIKKYKDLLDSGIITQEEFDAKKKQLLGL